MSTIRLDLETDTVALPPPSLSPQVTLERSLKRRHGSRAFLPDALPLDTLSAVLWAGFGVNRPDGLGRTAPAAHNWQEIDVYAVLAEGAYRHDAREHRLLLVSAEELRRHTGTQDFVATAPLELVYVADFSRMKDVPEEDRAFLAGADSGCIAQNVYLCCSGMGQLRFALLVLQDLRNRQLDRASRRLRRSHVDGRRHGWRVRQLRRSSLH